MSLAPDHAESPCGGAVIYLALINTALLVLNPSPLCRAAGGGALLLGVLLYLLGNRIRALRAARQALARAAESRALTVVLLAYVAAYLLAIFPPRTFGDLIFYDDYLARYSISARGWDMLAQGGVFGWEDRCLGGYHTAADINRNFIFFMLPVMAAGGRIAFHLMIVSSCCIFPLGVYWYTGIACGRRSGANAGMLVAVLFMLSFFDNILDWGMLDVFVAITLSVFCMLFFELLAQGRRYAAVLLMVSLALLQYAHLVIFVLTCATLVLQALLRGGKPLRVKMALVFAGVVLMTLPQTVYYVKYYRYFIRHLEVFDPVRQAAHPPFANLYQAFGSLDGFRDAGLEFKVLVMYAALLPLILRSASSRDARMRAIACSGAVLAAGAVLGTELISYLFLRASYLLPLFIAVFCGCRASKCGVHRAAFLLQCVALMLLLFSMAFAPRMFPTIRHIRDFRPALYAKMEAMDDDVMVFESVAAWHLLGLSYKVEGVREADVSPPAHVHMELELARSLDKKLLCAIEDGYHPSVYRGNAIIAGTFRGRPLTRVGVGEVEDMLCRWGIRHLILWSTLAKDYFSGHPEHFTEIWRDGAFSIFRYRRDAACAAAPVEEKARIVEETYFTKRIALQDVAEGEQIVLRCNYFPAWKVSWNGQACPTHDERGQLAFRAPASGSYIVSLAFPRYAGLSVLALIALAIGIGAETFSALRARCGGHGHMT